MLNLICNPRLKSDGLRIARLLQQGGFQAFWVGGTVRGMVLGQLVEDIDIATDAVPAEVLRILAKGRYPTKRFGEKFGTILAISPGGSVEITTFRKEGRYVDRRHPQEVRFVGSLEDDSERRDLTINSLYYDPVAKRLLDPQGGLKDIRAKLVRFVGDPKRRIDEDALRMLRAARFNALLGFRIEGKSFAAIKTRAKYLLSIPGERISHELNKMLSLKNRHDAVRLLDELGLLAHAMPEVTALKTVWHKSRRYHLEGNCFEHVMLVLKNMRDLSPAMAYAALYHDVSKAITAVPKRKGDETVNSFPRHEFVSCDLFNTAATRLRVSAENRRLVLWITKMHMSRFAFTHGMSGQKRVTLASHKYFPQLLELWRADSLSNIRLIDGEKRTKVTSAYANGRKLRANIEANAKLLDKLSDGEMILRETKLVAGPLVGKIKTRMRAEILAGTIKNLSQAKRYLKNYLVSS